MFKTLLLKEWQEKRLFFVFSLVVVLLTNLFIKFEESERYISIQYDGETIQALKSKELMKHLENIKKEIELNMIKDF